jgi:hypothetical protein
MPPALRDAKGCLSPAGLAAFRAAAPGRAPVELAAHVAGCARCQERALAADEGMLGPGKRKPPPPLWRVFALFFVGLVIALLLFFWTQRILSQH